MQGIAICMRGLETVLTAEIKELIKCSAKADKTVALFNTKQKDLAKLCYRSQSAVKVLEFLFQCKASNEYEKTIQSIEKGIAKIELSLLKDKSFKVVCKRIGKHDYHGTDISPKVGEFIIDKTNASVSLENPQVVVYVYIYENKCYVGYDYSGFDLSKRDYKVFTHPTGLNSTVAYGIYRMCKSKIVIDPFCGSGVIPIEAALYLAGKSPHFFRKDKFLLHKTMKIDLADFDKQKPKTGRIKAADHLLHYVKAAKNNAKLAGIELEATRMDIEWLDTKLDKHSFDIVTHPPTVSRQQDDRTIKKLYKEFFYQADYVVKDWIVILTEDDSIIKFAENFKVVEKGIVMQGGKEFKVFRIKRA